MHLIIGDDSIVELKVLRCICHLSSFIYHIHCEILMLISPKTPLHPLKTQNHTANDP